MNLSEEEGRGPIVFYEVLNHSISEGLISKPITWWSPVSLVPFGSYGTPFSSVPWISFWSLESCSALGANYTRRTSVTLENKCI